MKYIKKNLQAEPNALRKYRSKTSNAHYSGYIDKDIDTGEVYPLKKALLDEQGYICAYCMKRITLVLNQQNKPQVEVEHFLPQKLNPELDLVYQNMLGVCNGLSQGYPEKCHLHHCDKTNGEAGKINGHIKLKKLDPRSSSCEQLLYYNLEGEVLAVRNDEDVTHDLEKVLNLNNKALKNARKDIIDKARDKMKQEKPFQQWNKIFLEKHLTEWQSMAEGKFRPYCMAAVWFIETLLKKPHYNK